MNLVLILSATHQIKKRPAHREVFCLTIFDAVLAFYSFDETMQSIYKRMFWAIIPDKVFSYLYHLRLKVGMVYRLLK